MRSIFSMNEEVLCSSIIFEVSTGVGGQEAMLFARELYDMYTGYIEYKGWDADILQIDNTELGGTHFVIYFFSLILLFYFHK